MHSQDKTNGRAYGGQKEEVTAEEAQAPGEPLPGLGKQEQAGPQLKEEMRLSRYDQAWAGVAQ